MSEQQIAEAVELANIPTLLMLLVQLTGELAWSQPPFTPTPVRGLDDNDSGGLEPEVRERVLEAARTAVAAHLGGAPVAIPDPDDDLVVSLLSNACGEPVAPEYGPMVRAELAQVLAGVQVAQGPGVPGQHGIEAIIIGGGVSGICAGVRLAAAGVPYTILERNDRVGGVWSENRYPAAGVDTPSHLYSYSFAPGDWPRWFGSRQHIVDYLEAVAEHFEVLPHVEFGSTATRATYDDAAQDWVVEVARAGGATQTMRAPLLISAVGAFNTPAVPRLPGAADFTGESFHTARWPEDADLAGKRVAVLGNGASAMQVVPAIAPEVGEMVVFQMEPHWIAPFPKFKVMVPPAVRLLMQAVPLYHAWTRARLAWVFNDKLHATLRVDPEWPYPERSTNAANDRFRQFLSAYLRSELEGHDDLVEQLLPTYPPLGKRLLLDNGWYRTMAQDNVRLVSDLVTEVRPRSVVTASGEEIETDVIVYATGFDVVSFLSTLDVVGRSGRPLREVWGRDDAAAYLGLAVPDFPNFFVLYGPNTQTGHGGSLIGLVEAQMNHIIRLVQRMIDEDLGAVEVRPEIYTAYNDHVDDEHAHMVWTHPGMETYYRNSRGRVVVNSPFRVVDFWTMTAKPSDNDYLSEPARRPAAARA